MARQVTKRATALRKTVRKNRLELQHIEIIKQQVPRTFSPLSDNYSLAQPSPFRKVRSVVIYGISEEPIMG